MKNRISAIILVIVLAFSAFSSFVSSAEGEEFSENYIVTEVNGKRGAVSVVVFTPEFGAKTGTNGQGAEFAVSYEGVITSVGKNNSEIPSDGFVISFGPAKANQLPDIKPGDYAYFDKDYNCVTFVSSGYSPFGESVLAYDAINAARAENKLIIYRDREETKTNTWGVEAVVDANGIIISIGGNNSKIPEGGFVISGVGNKKQPITDACVLGYSAVLDETAKTVTVSYTKKNAYNSYDLRFKELKKQIEAATLSFEDVNYENVNASVNKLESLLNAIKESLDDDMVNAFIRNGYLFDIEVEILNNELVPYVPVETRTVWLRIPASANISTVKKTVNDICEMGFNSVCIEVLFDSTMIMPMPEGSLFEQNPVFKGQDMLKLYTDEFHSVGIEVHAWVSCYRVGHDGSANVNVSVGKKKPEWLNIDQNGKDSVTNEYGNAYFLNPSLPEVQAFLLETYRYILENYEIDGFQLDYVRYPENTTVNYGYDEYTKSLFKEKYGFEKAPTSSSQAGWAEWCKLRASFVTDLVRKTGALIKEIRPDVLFSCDVAPGFETTKTKMCQDTEMWLKEGLVDVIYPMAYGTTDAVIKWTDNTVELSGNGIQTVIGLRDNGAEMYREQILAARKCGADGTAFFSYSQYVNGNYKDYIRNSVFAKPAICPSYDAKGAVIAQLKHINDTISSRISFVIEDYETNADFKTLKDYGTKLDAFAQQLESSKLSDKKDELNSLISEGISLAKRYASNNDQVSDNISDYLTSALGIAEKALVNSLDDEKKAYKDSLNKSEGDSSNVSDEISTDASVDESQSDETTDGNTSIVIIVAVALLVVAVLAFILVKARKK